MFRLMRTGLGVVGGAILLLGWCAGNSFAADGKNMPTIDGVSFHAARGEVRNERTLRLQGSSTTLATWEERDAYGEFVPWAGVSLDGSAFARITEASYVLGLRYAQFDPLVNVPAVPAAIAGGDEIGLYIVQFITQPLEAFKNDIEARGGIVRHYVAQYAYLVEMDAAEKARVASLPYVRWIGRFEPAYRLEEYLLEHLDQAESAYPQLKYVIRTLDANQKQAVADRIGSIGGTIDRADAGKHLVEATLTPSQVFQVIRWNEVLMVERWSPYEPDMNIARDLGGANYVEGITGFSGEDVRGEVFDEGFNLGHMDFAASPLLTHGSVGVASHGTCTSGIVFGDGIGVPQARGMVPDGQGIVADYNVIGMTGPSRYTSTGQLITAPYNAVFQSSSVGSARTFLYTSFSADTDDALFDFDIAFCQSQSNAGTQDSRPQAWAKNIISGGGIKHQNTLTTTDDNWTHGASIGPASDGRIKPTLSAFYDFVWTTECCGTSTYTTGFNGTSSATPIVAGHVGIFHQMWDEGIFGNPYDPSGSVFENRPHAATARAMMINTAEPYPFTGVTHDLTRTHQGWGRPSLKNLYDWRDKFFIVDETDLLSNLETTTYYLEVGAGEPQLRVTLVYSDPAGNPAVQSQHRVNDLTLVVTGPNGLKYYGNHALLAGVWSSPAISPMKDTKNTEENVFLQNPLPGVWTVEIMADEVIQDSHIETPEMDADYALVVSGVLGAVATSVDPLVISPKDLALRIQGIRPGSTEAELSFNLATTADVRIALHDVLGRRIATLHDGALAAGAQTVRWNGRDSHGSLVAPGVYYARVEVGSVDTTGKLLIVR